MFLTEKKAHWWLFNSCDNATGESQWNIIVRQEVTVVWMVSSQQSELKFQLQSGF